MNPNWPLTKKEVETYQGLYYFHYKPKSKLGYSQEEIELAMAAVLEDVGWDWSRFSDYRSIDLMQRLVFEYSHQLVSSGHCAEPMTSKPEYRAYDPNFGAMRLKNDTLSEDKIIQH